MSCPQLYPQLCVTEDKMDMVKVSTNSQYPNSLVVPAKGSCCSYPIETLNTNTGEIRTSCDTNGDKYALNNVCTNFYNGNGESSYTPVKTNEWESIFDYDVSFDLKSKGLGTLLRSEDLPGETKYYNNIPTSACSIDGDPPINIQCGKYVASSNTLRCYHRDWTADPIQCCFQNMQCKMNPDGGTGSQPNLGNANCFAPSPPENGIYKYPVSTCKPDFRRLGAANTFYETGSQCTLQNPECKNCYTEVSKWCTLDLNSATLVERWVGTVTLNAGSGNSGSFIGAGPLTVDQPCTEFFFRTLYNSGILPALSSTEGTSTQRQVPPSNSSIQECDPNIINNALTSNTQSVIPNPEAYDLAKKVFVDAVTSYISSGGRLDSLPTDPNSSVEFNELVFGVCSKYPSMCTDFLNDYCQNLTPNDLSRSPATTSYCGCYLNPSVYNDIAGKFGINRECSAYCNLEGVIPLSDGTPEGSKTCNQSVCMINDITLNLVQSRIEGAINIGNFCNNCSTLTSGANSSTSCNCVLEGVTIDVVNSSINTINLNQSCASSVCYAKDGITIVDCATGTPADTGIPAGKTRANTVHNIIVVIIIVVFIILIFILYFLVAPRWRPPLFPLPELGEDEPSNPDRSYTSILNRF